MEQSMKKEHSNFVTEHNFNTSQPKLQSKR